MIDLSIEIQRQYDRLVKIVAQLPVSSRKVKELEGTGGQVCVADVIAYQIGWGLCVVRWYEAGIRGEMPVMPVEGFAKWDYTAIAHHFYKMYHFDGGDEQMDAFRSVVVRILAIVEIEGQTGNLDREGCWEWCTLASGKAWPLSKWIRVNTCAPYKRAASMVKSSFSKNALF